MTNWGRQMVVIDWILELFPFFGSIVRRPETDNINNKHGDDVLSATTTATQILCLLCNAPVKSSVSINNAYGRAAFGLFTGARTPVKSSLLAMCVLMSLTAANTRSCFGEKTTVFSKCASSNALWAKRRSFRSRLSHKTQHKTPSRMQTNKCSIPFPLCACVYIRM